MLETRELLIIIIASVIGSIVRITFEWKNKTITLPKVVLIVFCAAVIGYLIQGELLYLKVNKGINGMHFIGHFCVVGGIIAIDIINIFIEVIPKFITKIIQAITKDNVINLLLKFLKK